MRACLARSAARRNGTAGTKGSRSTMRSGAEPSTGKVRRSRSPVRTAASSGSSPPTCSTTHAIGRGARATPESSLGARGWGVPIGRPFSRPAMTGTAGRATILAVLAVACTTGLAGPAAAATTPPKRFPAAGELLRAVDVRAAPAPSARVIRRMRRFRADHQFQIALALSARRGADGDWWYRISLPGRPNGRRGWIRADAVDVAPGRRTGSSSGSAARRVEVRRVRDGSVLLRAIVAVGRPGAETPVGRDFYVASAFVPTDPFFGSFALETSAYSRLTDWPDDGIVGIHGTNRPALLGEAVSHGCVRVGERRRARGSDGSRRSGHRSTSSPERQPVTCVGFAASTPSSVRHFGPGPRAHACFPRRRPGRRVPARA